MIQVFSWSISITGAPKPTAFDGDEAGEYCEQPRPRAERKGTAGAGADAA